MHAQLIVSLAALCILTATAFSQPVAAAPGAPDGTVTGVGTATIERAPNLLRMQVELMTSGKDIKEVLAKLRAMEADARKKLVALGAAEASITAGTPRDANSKNPRRKRRRWRR